MWKKLAYQRPLWLLTGGWLLMVLAIIRPWQLYFLNDDFMHIPDERIGVRSGFLRPVPELLLALDKVVYGTEARGFFFTSALVFLACVITLFFVARQLQQLYFSTSHALIPLLAASLFLIYPWHAEALMFRIAGGVMVAALFFLLSLGAYLTSFSKPGYLVLAVLFFLLALFSYESVWNAFFVFGLCSWAHAKLGYNSAKASAWRVLVMWAIFIIYLLIRAYVLGDLIGDGYSDLAGNFQRIGFLAANFAKLALRIYTPPFQSSMLFVITGLAFTACIALAVRYAYFIARRMFWVLLSLAACMYSSVLTASLVGIDTHYNEGERYIFLASVFFCIMLSIILLQFVPLRRRKVGVAIFMMVYLTWFVLSSGHYHFASSITRQTVEAVQRNSTSNKLVVVNLPERYRGTPVFRVGLPDAVQWLAPPMQATQVSVLSRQPQAHHTPSFTTKNSTWPQLELMLDSAQRRLLTLQYDPRSNWLYLFKEDGLHIAPPTNDSATTSQMQ